MALFDIEETFMGLSDQQFARKVEQLSKKEKEQLYTKAKDRYYDGSPIMTDAQFDMLESDLSRVGSSVVEQVGGGTAGKLAHKHLSPMLSLSKEQVNDESKFDSTIKNIVAFFGGRFPLEAGPKYDGNAIELQYANGVLVKGVTRGKDGLGKDVTEAMKIIVPSVIPSKKTLEVRGEVVIPLGVFSARYQKNVGDGEDARYANARNMVGGVLNDDDIPVDKISDFFFVAYSLKAIAVDGSVQHVEDAMQNLKKLGFNSEYEPPTITVNGPSELRGAYEYFKKYRADGKMQLDGIVLKMPENLRGQVGENNHHPKWALAVKFPSKTAQTRLVFHPPYGVEWNVGPTGDLSPVGILEPVELDGSMVSRVSLYNKDKMEQGGLFAGALVTIKKSGDIIPAIIKVDIKSPRTDEFVRDQNYYPTECPACGSKLHIHSMHIRCVNDDCSAKLSRRLSNSLDALGIKGIGDATCLDLYKAGIKDVFDFFSDKMNESEMVSSGVFAKGRSLDIILGAANGMRRVDLDRVILSLQLPKVGKTISKEVAKMLAGVQYSFAGLETAVVAPFLNASSEESMKVLKLVDVLRSRGVDVVMPTNATGGIPYEMTGSPKDAGYAKKEDLIAYLETKGYVHTKINEAKILLTDSYNSSSSKMKTAEKKGVQILTYADLLEKLN